jgi:hypothetical protein
MFSVWRRRVAHPERNAMNATMTHQAVPFVSTSGAAHETGAVSGGPLTMLRLENAAALAGAGLAYSAIDGRWGVFAALFLVPDVSMLGYLAGRRVGAACYNAAHSYLGPVLLAALGTASSLHPAHLVACIWAAHVGFDRMLGYGLKYGTSFGDTHLGRHGSRESLTTPRHQVTTSTE